MINAEDFSTPNPPGSTVTCGILVVQWMDEEGKLGYGISVRGEEGLSTFIGLLERVQFDLMLQERRDEN